MQPEPVSMQPTPKTLSFRASWEMSLPACERGICFAHVIAHHVRASFKQCEQKLIVQKRHPQVFPPHDQEYGEEQEKRSQKPLAGGLHVICCTV
jgi:hypothetical protein